jgi:hypothetical protein
MTPEAGERELQLPKELDDGKPAASLYIRAPVLSFIQQS